MYAIQCVCIALHLSAKDKAEKAFALSYIRLMHDNGTVTSDGLQSLLVYKVTFDFHICDSELHVARV